jgi:hypothetical protein
LDFFGSEHNLSSTAGLNKGKNKNLNRHLKEGDGSMARMGNALFCGSRIGSSNLCTDKFFTFKTVYE